MKYLRKEYTRGKMLGIAAIDYDCDYWSFKSYEKCRQKSKNEI